MSLTRAAARGTAVTVGAQGVRFVLQMAALVVLARLLDPTDFGLVAMVAAVIGVAEIVRDFGLSSAAVQAPTLSRDERTNLFWANTGLGTASSLVALALTPLIAAMYDEPLLRQVVPALAGVFLLSGLATQYRADLGRSLRFGALATADVVSHGVGVAVAIALAALGAGFWALVAQQLVTPAVALVMVAVQAGWLPRWWQRGVSIRHFFRFGAHLLGTQLLGYGTKHIDTVAIGVALGAAPVGFYSRAYQLVMTPLNQVNTPLTRVALPVLSRVHEDPERFAGAVRRTQLVGCYVTATMLAVVAGLATPIVDVVLGAGWEPVAPILAVLAVGGVFRSVSQLSYWMFVASGRPAAQLRLDRWAQPLMMATIVLGVVWGAIGVAVAHAVAYACYWVVGLVVAGRATGVPARPLLVKGVAAVGLTGVPAGLAAWACSLLFDTPWASLAAGLAGAAVALGLVVLLVRPVRTDVLVLRDIARTVRSR